MYLQEFWKLGPGCLCEQAEIEPAAIVDITLRRRPTCQSRYEDFHYKDRGGGGCWVPSSDLFFVQEASVLETVVRDAVARDVNSAAALRWESGMPLRADLASSAWEVHACIENVGLKEVWLKIAGGEKASIII